MKKECLVIEKKGDRILLRSEREDACASCSAACTGCRKVVTVWTDNTVGAEVGDRVIVEDSSSRTLLLCAMIFFLPSFFGVLAMLIASGFCSETATAVIAACVFSLSMLAGLIFAKTRKWTLLTPSERLEK